MSLVPCIMLRPAVREMSLSLGFSRDGIKASACTLREWLIKHGHRFPLPAGGGGVERPGERWDSFTHVITGLVPVITIKRSVALFLFGVAGASPAMTVVLLYSLDEAQHFDFATPTLNPSPQGGGKHPASQDEGGAMRKWGSPEQAR